MKETVMRHSRIQKRASRFSQVKEKAILWINYYSIFHCKINDFLF